MMAEAQSASANKQNARFRLISVLLAMLINDGGASFEREKLRGSLSQKSSLPKKFLFATYCIRGCATASTHVFGDSQYGYCRLNIFITLARDLYQCAP